MNQRNILILTYYWPPASGPAVNRILSWVKYLTLQGHTVHILTVSNPSNLAEDESLVSEIPDKVIIHKSKTLEPFAIYNRLKGKKKNSQTVGLPSGNASLFNRIALWIRLNLFVPDPRIGWKFTAVKSALNIIEKNAIDVLITTSPPHSTQLIGRQIKRKSGVRWIADLRDPWTKLYHYDNQNKLSFAKKKERRLEKQVLSQSDHVITVGQKLADDFGHVAKKTTVIYNGYPSKKYKIEKSPSSNFQINYVGNISTNEVHHEAWSAISTVASFLDHDKISLGFTGNVHPELYDKVKEENLEDIVTYHGYQSHRFALNKIWNSDLLLLIIPRAKENKYIITSKIFEYLNAHVPILGIGPIDGEAAEILNNTSYASMFDYDDMDGMVDYIQGVMQERPSPSKNDISYIQSFSRKNQARKLTSLLFET